jgi:oligopeptidase B
LSPQDYRGIVAQVPFVDVVTTMLDDSIPLTTNEYDEWGNPADRQSTTTCCPTPLRQRGAQDYPAMLITTGLWDSQVQYYEPAKWVAKLRAVKTDQNPRAPAYGYDAGHGGKSGRFHGGKYAFRSTAGSGFGRRVPGEANRGAPISRKTRDGRAPARSLRSRLRR